MWTAELESHAIRLELDTAHLGRLSPPGRLPSEAAALIASREARTECLRSAAGTLAATWFTLRGFTVSLPAEPAVYDLLAGTTHEISRVQVKTRPTTRTQSTYSLLWTAT